MQEDDSRKHGYGSNDENDEVPEGVVNTADVISRIIEEQRRRYDATSIDQSHLSHKSQEYKSTEIQESQEYISTCDTTRDGYSPRDSLRGLTLDEYVVRKSEVSIEESEEIIARGGWQSRVWAFIRGLKDRPETMNLTARQVLRKFDWDRTMFDADDKVVFVDEWPVCVLGESQSPLSLAAQLAKIKRYISATADTLIPGYGDFLNLVVAQTKILGEQPIILPVRAVGEILDVAPRTVSRYRRIAIREGILTVVAHHTRTLGTKFRVNINRLSENIEKES